MSLQRYTADFQTAIDAVHAKRTAPAPQEETPTLEGLFSELDQEISAVASLEEICLQLKADVSLAPTVESLVAEYATEQNLTLSQEDAGGKIGEIAHAVWERIKAILKRIKDFILELVEKLIKKFTSLKHSFDKTRLAFRTVAAPHSWVNFTVDQETAEWVSIGVKSGAPLKAKAILRSDDIIIIVRNARTAAEVFVEDNAHSEPGSMAGLRVQNRLEVVAEHWNGNLLARTLPQNVMLSMTDEAAVKDANHKYTSAEQGIIDYITVINHNLAFHHVFEQRESTIPKEFETQLSKLAQEVFGVEGVIDLAEDVLGGITKEGTATVKSLERVIDEHRSRNTYDPALVRGLQGLASIANKALGAAVAAQGILSSYCSHYLKFADAAIAASATASAK
jgi:hypothetical protein